MEKNAKTMNKDVAKKEEKTRMSVYISNSTLERFYKHEKENGKYNKSLLFDILLNEFLDGEDKNNNKV